MKLWTLGIAMTLLLPASNVFAQDIITSNNVVINEFQTGGFDELNNENGRHEFIELFNNDTEAVSATGWKLQYFAASREDVYDLNAVATRELGELTGKLTGKGYVLFSYDSYIQNADVYFGQGSTASSGLLAKSGGHIRLVSPSAILDVVGWGTAKKPEIKAVSELLPGTSMQRISVENSAQDIGNNFLDFIAQASPIPQSGGLIELPAEEIPEPERIIPPCIGVMISEIVPNPDGTDTGKEYIELYNPTDNEIYLEGCTLKLGSQDTVFSFEAGGSIKPQEYKVFYDSSTGIVLPNAAGGEIVLRGTESDYAVQYPSDMEANQSWAYIAGVWRITTVLTPGAANVLPPEVLTAADEESSLEPCGPGKYRNAETNRCRNIQVTASQSACPANQVRNPETNRCRTIVALATSLLPCREGQERNPETNRCRNISSSAAVQCQEGYERNPETNRCRKIPAVLATSPSVGSLSGQSQGKINHLFLVLMSVLVLCYGAFEYRRDLSNLWVKIQTKRLAKLAAKQ